MEILRYKELDYVLRMPKHYEQSEKYPLVIYTHGAGGRGREIQKIVEHPFFIETEPFSKLFILYSGPFVSSIMAIGILSFSLTLLMRLIFSRWSL